MNSLAWAGLVIFAVVATGVLLFFILDKLERWSERKQSMEMKREALRQRETIEIIREVGRQTLGTLRPGEVVQEMEEAPPSPVDGSTLWWTEPGDDTDPTDETMPDPDRQRDDDPNPGVPNLG